MKQLILTAALSLTGLWAQAQVSETRTAPQADKIEVHNGIQVIYTEAATALLKVEAQNAQALSNVVTTVKKGTLKIDVADASAITAAGMVKVYVQTPQLVQLTADKGASILVKGKLTAENIAIKLLTGANFTGEVDTQGTLSVKAVTGAGARLIAHATKFESDIKSGAHIIVTGSCNEADIFSSGGTLQGGKFICHRANVFAKNAAAVAVNTTDYLSTYTDTSSAIKYYGDPAKVVTANDTYTTARETQKLTLN